MPHKRATRSVRERARAQRGADLAPKIFIEHEPVPKSVSRVLNAGQIRREYRKKKRPAEGVGSSGEDAVQHKKSRRDGSGVSDDEERTALNIKPGETVPMFNRRVENRMMPLIKTALRRSSAQARRVRRKEAAQEISQQGEARYGLPERETKGSDPLQTAAVDEGTNNPRSAMKEFPVVSTDAPRRLNDIAQEPPVIKKLPRGATKNDAAPSGVLSMAQMAMMEEERDKAIRHYRELKLKARKQRENGGCSHTS